MMSVDFSQKPRTNRSPRPAFRESDEEEAHGTCVLVPFARIGAGLIIGLHRIRDGLNTCASRSLSSSRISSCRAVTNPPFLQPRAWFTSNFLDSPHPSQDVGRFEGITCLVSRYFPIHYTFWKRYRCVLCMFESCFRNIWNFPFRYMISLQVRLGCFPVNQIKIRDNANKLKLLRLIERKRGIFVFRQPKSCKFYYFCLARSSADKDY